MEFEIHASDESDSEVTDPVSPGTSCCFQRCQMY
jgi:hypothetical protein